MPAVVVVGTQWGDEGKGKATDQLGQDVDYVVKFNGGNNAGHTVVIDGEAFAFHLLPAGVLTPGVTPMIGNGVVVDLEVLFSEIAEIEARGRDASSLRISASAHLIPSYNRVLDRTTERFLGARQLGTTGRGIGPTYADKMNRVGLRIQDLFDESILRQKVHSALDQKNGLFLKVFNRPAIDPDEVADELLSYADRVRPMVVDCSLVLNDALDAGRTVLFEAGQATMLDIDHGTYPFVTSSNPTAGVVTRYAARVNGLTDLVMTKLDVLTGHETIPVCVAYDVDGVRTDEMPLTQTDFHHAEPIYEELPGWAEDITGVRAFSDLPQAAQDYVTRIEELARTRVSAIGVGPGREATIVRHPLLG